MTSNMMMQAIALRSKGVAFDLAKVEQPLPVLEGNDLLIKIDYVALNHLDAKLATKGHPDWIYPHVVGLDAVGTVVQAPKGVFPTLGARVLFTMCTAQQGLLKEYATVPNHCVAELPDSLRSDVAVTLPHAGMTALLAIEKLQIESGDTLAINSGQGAVAHFAIQYAKKKGAKVFVFAQKKHHERLLKLGADHVFDCEKQNVCEQIKRELGGGGFDCILNTQGNDSFLDDLKRLRFCGRIVCLNGFSEIPECLLMEKAPNIGVVSLAGAWLSNNLCAQQKLCFMGEQLLNDVVEKRIQAPQIELLRFDVKPVQQALEQLLNHTCIARPVVKLA
ncbi:putative oxidoreductase [Pseudoalteromonas luteoviolacea B = ATCC 29581]|nr:putative oxidoreductase [Pseudoalteromonas luteoviolacea B = ATCC 29581]